MGVVSRPFLFFLTILIGKTNNLTLVSDMILHKGVDNFLYQPTSFLKKSYATLPNKSISGVNMVYDRIRQANLISSARTPISIASKSP